MKVPSPPSNEEKLLYIHSGRWKLYAMGLPSYLLLAYGMLSFSFAQPHTLLYLPIALLYIFYLGLGYFIGIFGKDFSVEVHQGKVLPPIMPEIDIYLPCCGEPLQVLENTYKHVDALFYPEGKLHVYVLDDGGSEEVAKLAARFGFGYISRPAPRLHKKAGNLRYAFNQTSSPWIAIFDADFCPRKDFFYEMLPYAMDEKTAIVQSTQFFTMEEHSNWIGRGAAFVQELFYRLIQVNRDTHRAAICVGTNAIYRRKALEPFGGTALMDYSEDMHTGFFVTAAGSHVKYIPLNLAKGLCPETLPQFFSQQYRWAMGTLTLAMNPVFWKSSLTVMQKLSYMTGMFYYTMTSLGLVIGFIPSFIMLLFWPDHIFWYNAFFSIPSLIFGTLYYARWSKFPWGLYVMKSRLVSYYAHLFAVRDKLTGNLMPWIPTGVSSGSQARFLQLLDFLYWNTVIQLLLGVGLVAYRLNERGLADLSPFLFVLLLQSHLALSTLRDQDRPDPVVTQSPP